MKSTQKLAELTDLVAVKNPEEVKGGFFFLSHLFGGYHARAYEAPKHGYEAPKKNEYDRGGKGSGKKGY